jgi:hypothetical protein
VERKKVAEAAMTTKSFGKAAGEDLIIEKHKGL